MKRHARLLWVRARTLSPALLLCALFVVSGLRGVDFGHHWDEVEWQLKPVREMVASGIMMPRAEIYPGLPRWLVLVPALPAGLGALLTLGQPRALQHGLAHALDKTNYLLDARGMFIVVSALAILWLYLAARALRRPVWEASVAAAGLGLSWEYAYHSRWLATDCIVVQFSALTLYLLALFYREKSPKWLYAAAVSVGLGMGTKYPAIVLLVPVLVSSVLTLPKWNVRGQLLRLVALTGLAGAAYLVTTPATLFEPFAFVERARFITASYERQNAGYGVGAGWDHLRVVLGYFALAYFSPYRAVALALFSCSLLGIYAWVRDERRLALVVLAFPVAFLVFFAGRYRTAVVRNYLLLAPFLAVFMARGIGQLATWCKPRAVRRAGAGVLSVVALAQAFWLVQAGESIRHVSPDEQVRSAFDYIHAHPDTRFRISPLVRGRAAMLGLGAPDNVTSAPAQAVVLFARAEGPSSFDIRSNDPFLTLAVFGPREVNFNFYSTWAGHDRVIVMTEEKALLSRVSLAL